MNKSKLKGEAVFIVDGARTPQLKAQGQPGPFQASDLGFLASRSLLARLPIQADQIDQVIVGCVGPGPDEANIARIIGLRLGCGEYTPAWTVQRNCASGLQAIDTAALEIASGRSKLILAGGTEAMSHHPVLLSTMMVNWLGLWSKARTVSDKGRLLAKLKPTYLKPVISLLRGLTDPVVGLSMGQTAEELAFKFNISRHAMDEFAVRSHMRLGKAIDDGHLDEIVPIYDDQGVIYEKDDGYRSDSSMEKLHKLRPVFDRQTGKVTAANSAQVSDGAAMLVLASESAIKKYSLPVLGRIVDTEWAGLAPEQMGLGPVHAMSPIMTRHNLNSDDIDFWEINEAFAAQVLACTKAWSNNEFCKDTLKLTQPYTPIDPEHLNIDGGGISLGHPVGASGARIVLHLLNTLKRENKKRGMASLCIGGGQGGAIMLEAAGG